MGWRAQDSGATARQQLCCAESGHRKKKKGEKITKDLSLAGKVSQKEMREMKEREGCE